jgi:hypothetical protein
MTLRISGIPLISPSFRGSLKSASLAKGRNKSMDDMAHKKQFHRLFTTSKKKTMNSLTSQLLLALALVSFVGRVGASSLQVDRPPMTAEHVIMARELAWAEKTMEAYRQNNRGAVPTRSSIGAAPHVHSEKWKEESLRHVLRADFLLMDLSASSSSSSSLSSSISHLRGRR